jgi:hypothetical protein
MRFNIFDTATGGTSLWYSGVVSVQITDGNFSVLLGQSPQPAIDLPFDEDYWLNIWIDGDTQTPRQRLGSTGFAYMASGLIPGTEVIGSVTEGTGAAIAGTNTATTDFTYGLYGESASEEGHGVYGNASATTGFTYGVYGESQSNSGRGVYGYAFSTTGTTYGVYGHSRGTGGRGVSGYASSTTGTTYGVYGESLSTSGRGVYGASNANTGTTYGVYGSSVSTSGRGVYGYAGAFSGTTYGVYGETVSEEGRGVFGNASATSGTNYGVYGKSESATGYAGYFQGDAKVTGDLSVDGTLDTGVPFELSGSIVSAAVISGTNSSIGRGVDGTATATAGITYGVYGTSASTSGRGACGIATATTGNSYGVSGASYSTSGRGVSGIASATSGTNYGVYGSTGSGSGYGGYFDGRLYATTSINLSATPGNHVAQIYNTSTGTSPDVLSLKVGYNANPSGDINFITFFRGGDVAVGAIEGDGGGGVTYKSGSADFAEFLPRWNRTESMESGDVVGIHSGKVSKTTQDAALIMVVSTRPIVLGNDPGDEYADAYEKVAFIGQVDVKVRGPVEAGDLLVASGMNDGTAVAVAETDFTHEQLSQVVGQAWQSSMDSGVKKIRASIGLANHSQGVARMARRIRQLEARLDALENKR